jgi:hypothetical protein
MPTGQAKGLKAGLPKEGEKIRRGNGGLPYNRRNTVPSSRSVLVCTLISIGLAIGPSIALSAQLDLNWVDSSDGQASFIVRRAPGGNLGYTNIAQLPPGITSYSDKSVSPDTTYCYQVAGVEGGSISPFSTVACAKPGGGFSVSVTKTGAASGSIGSSPPGIVCGATCSFTYPAGKVVTLTAVPAPGSTFIGWSRGGCSGTRPCTMVGNVPVTVTATFAVLPVKTETSLTGRAGKDGTR